PDLSGGTLAPAVAPRRSANLPVKSGAARAPAWGDFAVRAGYTSRSMATSEPAAPRQQKLAALVRAVQSGQFHPVYLLIGESFETRAAAQQLLDALVPEARRAFNLETY